MSDFTWQQKWLAIAPKPFAVLSILGSLYIARQILGSKQRRGEVLSRILLGLSLYDISTSTALFVGTWTTPAGTPGVFMASGTEATCSAHGFFVQMGVGTPLYNASLATYYYLAVRLGWNERRLRRAELFLHLVPILFSFGTSIFAAARGLYANSQVWCWLDTSYNSAFRLGLMYGPVWACMVVITLEMGAISAHVFRSERKIRKYGEGQIRRRSEGSGGPGTPTGRGLHRSSSMSSIHLPRRGSEGSGGTGTPPPANSTGRPTLQRSSSMASMCSIHTLRRRSFINRTAANERRKASKAKKVATQALFYVFAFILTWLFPSWTRISQMIHGSSPFWPFAIFCITYPLQGFLNFLVYVRPRYQKYRRMHPEYNVGESLRNIRRASFANSVRRTSFAGTSRHGSGLGRQSSFAGNSRASGLDSGASGLGSTTLFASEPPSERGSFVSNVSDAPDEEWGEAFGSLCGGRGSGAGPHREPLPTIFASGMSTMDQEYHPEGALDDDDSTAGPAEQESGDEERRDGQVAMSGFGSTTLPVVSEPLAEQGSNDKEHHDEEAATLGLSSTSLPVVSEPPAEEGSGD